MEFSAFMMTVIMGFMMAVMMAFLMAFVKKFFVMMPFLMASVMEFFVMMPFPMVLLILVAAAFVKSFVKVSVKKFIQPLLQPKSKKIYFRAYKVDSWATEFYSILLDANLNHSGEPKFLKPFHKSSTVSGVSGFAAVDSGLFCVGGLGGEKRNYYKIPDETCKIYGFNTEGREIHVGKMVSPRTCPCSLGMGGILYIFGALVRLNDSWAEIFTPSSNSSRPLPLPTSSSSSSLTKGPLATAALHSWKKILVASCFSNSAYLLDVMTEKWEEFDHTFDFSAVRGAAAVVRNTTLCWFDDTFHVLKAYDLVLKMSFREPIKGLDKVGVLFPGVSETDCSLLALDDNHLCLLWIDHRGYDDTFDSLLHCTKVRVSLDNGNNNGTARFDASVDSSRSFVLEEKSSFLDALVL